MTETETNKREVGFVMDTGLHVYPKKLQRNSRHVGCAMPAGHTIIGTIIHGVKVACWPVKTNGGDVLVRL